MQINQLVHQNGDRLYVTTLDISNRFAKQHKNVMQSIENIECSQQFRRLSFKPSSYNNAQNKAQPMFEITRDGFVFLCMGFTGSQAALWKERYIEAFNQMETALRGGSPAIHQQQITIARENGQLRDMVANRDMIITAKDQVIMGLQDKLIGSQGRQIRLIGQVANMQKRQHDKEIITLIETMELEGRPRDEIAKVTGKPLIYIRQRIFIARAEGRLPNGKGGKNVH